MNSIATLVLKHFGEKFSGSPKLYFSPGRINLIGEHIDYNDGYVMPAAIDKGIYFSIAENQTDTIHFYAIDFDEHFSISIHGIQINSGWRNYVLSVVNEFNLLGISLRGFNCVFGGDIPQGAGMSSSAALEGGLAFALNEMFAVGLNRVALALLCQRAEHNFPNVNCGIMDQFANMMGKKDQVILLDCKTLEQSYFPLVKEGYKIVLMNSKVHHSLAAGEYNIRRQRCEQGLAILTSLVSIQSFRDITSADELEIGKSSLTLEQYNCCKYVVEEIGRTKKASKLLQSNDMEGFGKLMFATHQGLSKLYEVSCGELDFLVEQAKLFPAVIGSRLMGGGFGGCTINIVEEAGVENFIQQTILAYQKEFNIQSEAYIVATSDGTANLLF
jgi:galactokinase